MGAPPPSWDLAISEQIAETVASNSPGILNRPARSCGPHNGTRDGGNHISHRVPEDG